MQQEMHLSIAIDHKWGGVSIKSVCICESLNTLFGSGRGCFDIFVIDLENYILKGNFTDPLRRPEPIGPSQTSRPGPQKRGLTRPKGSKARYRAQTGTPNYEN